MKNAFCSLLLFLCIGCASAPIIPAVERLQKIAADPVLQSLPKVQRVAVEKALTQAKKEVTQAKQEEKKAASWAAFGKNTALVLGGVGLSVLAFVAFKLFL